MHGFVPSPMGTSVRAENAHKNAKVPCAVPFAYPGISNGVCSDPTVVYGTCFPRHAGARADTPIPAHDGGAVHTQALVADVKVARCCGAPTVPARQEASAVPRHGAVEAGLGPGAGCQWAAFRRVGACDESLNQHFWRHHLERRKVTSLVSN